MARASYRTLVSLDRYAKLIGLDPVHFAGATAGEFWMDTGSCEDIWRQYPWQTPENFVSREELAHAIYNAEKDIETILGYSIAPRFINAEQHNYPRPAMRRQRGYGGWDVRFDAKTIKTRFGKIIKSGKRGLTMLLDNAPVTYSDADGDTWKDQASITLTDSATDLAEIKLYFVDKLGDPAWEIRPLRSITRTGTTITILLDSWLLINPVLWEQHPQSNTRPAPIDIAGTSNFVQTVEVQREYVDETISNVDLLWNPGFPYEAQTGYLSLIDPQLGYVAPYAATYTDGEWRQDLYANCSEPDRVKIWYYAGAVSDEFLAGYTTDPLSDYFATTVMWLATARLAKTLCSCSHARNTATELQRDMTQITKSTTFVLNLATDLFTNPLGTKVGEYRAWQRLVRLTDDYVNIGGVA